MLIDYDGEYLLVNSAKGRVKDRNMEQRPNVAIEISDPDDPYRYIAIRGRVVEITEEGGAAHIDKLNLKYRGNPQYPLPEGQVRRIYKITCDKIEVHG